MYNLTTPMPGGSAYPIQYDDQLITIHLPPVGYAVDRVPNTETGKPSFELVKCEILFDNYPPEKQKWTRTELPHEWKKWREEERNAQKTDPRFIHPKCDRFRKQEWLRRINGVWMAIWDPIAKKTEYVYLPGIGYFYFNWWRQDFGYPKFRFVYLKVYYGLQYADDHLLIHGVTLSTNRRFGKSSIAYCWQFEYCSRVYNARGGSQAQTKVDAKKKWDTCMIYGWKRVPDFFRPKYDYNVVNELKFNDAGSGTTRAIYDEITVMDETTELGGGINFRESKSTSYDGEKIHRGILEEPGKWIEEDVYKTLRVMIPCTMELGSDEKIGLIFAPTTIEDLKSGGYEFIDMFEDSFPALMKKNEDGKTTSGLIAIFIPAYEGYLFDEYGRSVIDDPPPGIIVYDEKGKPLKQSIGAKSVILKGRAKFKNDRQKYAEQVRKFPFTWSEAKMMADQESPFNLEILMKRYNELNAMPGQLYIMGNFAWVNEIDGDVEFVRDDLGGRWAMGIVFDKDGGVFEDSAQITNRVGVDIRDGKKLFYPKNDRMFTMGSDPIKYGKSDDPRSSKAGAYVFYKYDPNVDGLTPHPDRQKSYNFIAQYLYRPDEFVTYAEDVIMAMRYFGCSVCAEDNVQSLRQHLEGRGYELFLMFKSDFDNQTLMNEKKDAWKGVAADEQVIHTYVSRLISFVLKHGHRLIFPQLIKQMMEFTIKERTKFDGVVAAGYTLIGAEKRIEGDPFEEVDVASNFRMYSQDGNRSRSVDINEDELITMEDDDRYNDN